MINETYDQKIQRAVNHAIPVYAHLELTYRCNEHCIHCYALANRTKQKELSSDEFKSIFDQLADLGTLYLVMTGGEIFCRGDFFEIAQYARKKSFALRLFTNGLSVTPEIISQLVDLNPLRIEISLYGLTPKVHDQITGITGSFRRTRQAIDLLLKNNLALTIKTPVMRSNCGEIIPIKQFARAHHVEFISNPTIVPRSDGSKDNLQYRLSDADLQNYFLQANHEWSFKNPNQNGSLCGAGKGMLAVSPYGDITPCVQLPIKAGNVRNRSLQHLWLQSPELIKLRSTTLSNFRQCAACPDIDYCNPCPGLAMVEDGDMLNPCSEACRQARIRRAVFASQKIPLQNSASAQPIDACVI